MTRHSLSAVAVLLLQGAATFAAPNIALPQARPALKAAEASTLATATAEGIPSVTEALAAKDQFQADLKIRELPDALEKRLQSSFTVANTFTHLNASLSQLTLPGTAMLTSSASTPTSAGPMAVGSFTGADGGVYEVTSQSGYVVIDGKTLAPGQQALIGNEEVSDGAGGLVANGQTVMMSTVSMTVAEVTTTTAAAATTSGSTMMNSAAGSSSMGTTAAAASSSGSASAASAAGSSSSKAAAAVATNAVAHGKLVAVAGGVLGLMIL